MPTQQGDREARHHKKSKAWIQYCRVPKNGGGGGGGVDGPSLDRSYFSCLQPISFLIFAPSSSHVAKLVASTRYLISMLHTHAWQGERLKCFDPSKCSRFEVSNAVEEDAFTATLFACGETVFN